MALPPQPPLKARQRYAGRFWNTDEIMESLALYYGVSPEVYPRTLGYRVLIAVHREQNSTKTHGKGYGADWKCLKAERDKNGVMTGRFVPDTGFPIKRDVLEYARLGKIPLNALQRAAASIREVEQKVWIEEMAARRRSHIPLRIAAE